MQRHTLLLLAAVAASLLSIHIGATTAIAKVHSFAAVSEKRGVLTFKVGQLDAPRIRSASVSGPRGKSLKVNIRRVRKAAQSGVLRVRMPRAWLRKSSRTGRILARGAHHVRGAHTLRVVTDTTPPQTSITAGPTGTISSSAVRFSFESSESRSTFECRLGASSWAACSSPKSYSGLARGAHTFEVRAKDAAANIDATPAARSFTIDAATPGTDTGTPGSDTGTPATPAGKATTRPVGSPPLSDAEAAARVHRNGFEPRGKEWPISTRIGYWGGTQPKTTNYPMNNTVPTKAEIDAFNGHPENAWAIKRHITGNFTGTTDEIIQWAAHKHGLDEDLVRAVAAIETWWRQGDGTWADANGKPLEQGGGIIAMSWHANTFPTFAKSTAANLDYFGATMRHYYDGEATWFNTVERGQEYKAGDIWGCIGAHYAGRWRTPAAETYVARVQSETLIPRVWEHLGF